MKKRKIAVVLLLVAIVISALSLTACDTIFANNDVSRYIIDIGKVEDSQTANFVANNTIPSCVRVIAEYKVSSLSTAASGFIITEDGYVLTNRHCAVCFTKSRTDKPFDSDDTVMSAKYKIVFADNISYSATLVAYSLQTDLAVLKISTLPLFSTKFQPLVFETQEDLYYGERVYTMGNPGNIGIVFTELSISSPALKLNSSDSYNAIILDGNINHGNSGGPLLNAYSRVSGIVFARLEGEKKDTYGLGCAIPTKTILSFLDSVNGVKNNYLTTPVDEE